MKQITVVGTVGFEPKLETTRDGKKVCHVSIGVSNGRNKETNEYNPMSNFRVSFWDQRAETIAEYVKKGDKFAASGELDAYQYEHNGEVKLGLDIKNATFTIIGSVEKREQQQQPQQPRQQTQTSTRRPF